MSEHVTVLKRKFLNGFIGFMGLFKIVKEYVFTKNIAEKLNIPLICCIFISV